jgi:hypothetical protein
MDTISGRRPLEGAAVGAAAALTAAAPVSSAASAGRLASRFGRPWFPSWRRLIGTAGPGLLIAVGYIDPGNWATDLGGGSRYGYALLSMVLIANLIAMVAQALCVRLAIATGRVSPNSRARHIRGDGRGRDGGDRPRRAGGRGDRPQAPVRKGLVPGVLLMSAGTLVLLLSTGRCHDDPESLHQGWRWKRTTHSAQNDNRAVKTRAV